MYILATSKITQVKQQLDSKTSPKAQYCLFLISDLLTSLSLLWSFKEHFVFLQGV